MWRVASVVTVVLGLLVTVGSAQQAAGAITGTVTDDAGAPVADARVALENMNVSATTTPAGSYRLEIPAARVNDHQATLRVQRLGFRPKSAVVTLKAGTQTVDFVIAPQAVVLQQVVVTGEGTMTTNEKLGESVNVVDGDQVVNSGETNLVNGLSAKAPNVQIQSQSGDPGSSTSIQIRGIKSFSGDAQPLFVVDGVPVDNSTLNGAPWGDVVAPNRISDINPEDIESLTILKGAAASAIYGARASQGVVLITTKRGAPGTTRYSLTASYSSSDVTQGNKLQRTFGETNSCDTPNCLTADPFSWGPPLAPGTPTYDHFGEMFETGAIWNSVLSISGGDSRRSFFLSAGYTANQGFVIGPNDSYDRVTINVKGSEMVGDRVQVSGKISYANTDGSYVQRGYNGDGMFFGALRTPPEFNNLYYLDSTYHLQREFEFPHRTPETEKVTQGLANPIFSIYEDPASSTLHRVYGNLDLNWQAADWLTLQWTPGLDYYTDARYEGLPWSNTADPIGVVVQTDLKNFIAASMITIVGTHTFSPTFSGSLTLGNEINSTTYTQLMIAGDDLVTAAPLVLANVQDIFYYSDYQSIIHRQSYFGQVTGDLDDQLFLTLALRNDGYSTFGQNDQRAWYPKASAAWNFSKSMDVSAGSVLQFGKLRLAYGETGKEPPVYSTLSNYVVSPYGPGVTSSAALGNSALRPERQHELEGGFDIGLWNGLVSVSATAYASKASDVILALPLPPASGADSQIQNGATVQNNGVELQLNVTSLASTKSVHWTLGFMWARNRNEVLAINGGVSQIALGYGAIPGIQTVGRVGSPIGAFAGGDFARCGRGVVLADGTALDNTACRGQPTGAMYIAADGFPVGDPTIRILGSAQPDWAGAISGSITVATSLQFSFLVDIRHGSQAYNGTRASLYRTGTHQDTEIRGQFRTFGTDFFPGPVVGPGAGIPVTLTSTWFQGEGSVFTSDNIAAPFVENAGFTKLREIAVQYTWSGPWVTKSLGLTSVRVRVAGRNLATWTGYSGIDPEMNLEGAGMLQGLDWYNNPQTRSLVFSIGLDR